MWRSAVPPTHIDERDETCRHARAPSHPRAGRPGGGARIALPVLVVLTAALVGVPLSGAQSKTSTKPVGISTVHVVTLVTGDVVRVAERSDGRRSVSLEPTETGAVPNAAISEAGDHLYVVPQRAARLLAKGRLDLDLFDVAALIDLKYDDASRSTIPVIVDYGRGTVAADESRSAAIDAAKKTVTIASVGAAAYSANKERARGFWRSLTTGVDASGAATGLSDGAARVDLDGRVEPTLDVSVPQIHAPEAWAAGYDGTGSKVAVLDTGYDPTHPDLAGQVTETANFTTDPTVTDGNGHGTHVASTIAGTGAASGGKYRGVAPGADLMIGKVLADAGYGEDSWVMAGMEWAVAQHADVVSMSLGGDVTDGTDPLSLAIDDLSAQSDTLFVVAAGNNGATRDGGSAGRSRRRADGRRGRRHRHARMVLEPRPALRRPRAQAGRVSSRRLDHRRPSGRDVGGLPGRRLLHESRRHVDGNAARLGGRSDPQERAPLVGRRADQVRHQQLDRARAGVDGVRDGDRAGRRSECDRLHDGLEPLAESRELPVPADRPHAHEDAADLREPRKRARHARPLSRGAGRRRETRLRA